jgi:hypothetical protein
MGGCFGLGRRHGPAHEGANQSEDEEDALGQSLCFFIPSRTSWSEKMSNQPNSTPSPRRIPTVWREKPHWGASGLPFMKSMMGARRMRASSRSDKGTAALGVAEVVESGAAAADDDEPAEGANDWSEADRAGAHEPECRERSVCP